MFLFLLLGGLDLRKLQRTSSVHDLHSSSVRNQLVGNAKSLILCAREASESKVVRHENFLTAGKFVLGAAQRLHSVGLVDVLGAHAHQNLANSHTSASSGGLSPRLTHSSLQSIGSGASQHLVDADHVVRVNANAHVKVVLSSSVTQVTVGALTGSLDGLASELLLLHRHQVHAQRKVLDGRSLASDVVDADLGIGHTAAVSALDVRLILAITSATSRTSSLQRTKRVNKNSNTKITT